jgi:hypothetical protein
MYLFEMKDLPKSADKAALEWDRGVRVPSREGKRIALPLDQRPCYFPLQEGRQFLLYLPRGGQREAWFGGTDEEPFLVEMNPEVIEHFLSSSGSAEAFYNYLVPESVTTLSGETGVPYRRQGDIFAARFCGEQYFEKRLARLLGNRANVHNSRFRVLGTRHEARGTVVTIDEGGVQSKTLVRGTIEAPDHKPLVLDDGIYLLDQTRHIVHPTKAD